jgi:hypothetical protein
MPDPESLAIPRATGIVAGLPEDELAAPGAVAREERVEARGLLEAAAILTP